MSEKTELRAGDPVLDRPRHTRPGRRGRVLRRPVRLGAARGRERRADRRLPDGAARRQAGRRSDEADAGGPAARLDHLHRRSTTPTRRPRRRARRAAPCIVEPMSVLDYGRMAVLADPTGAVFGIWQAGTNVGAGVVNEPGAITWNELNTRDPEAAKAFYGVVFGWTFEDEEFEGDRHLHDDQARREHGRRPDRHHRAASRRRCPPTGWSTSRSRTPTATLGGRASGRRRRLRADRHPRVGPLRGGQRPLRGDLRRDPARTRSMRGAGAQETGSEGARSATASAGSPASPSSSHSAGSPRLALLTTLRPSIAHFIRVAEMSIPSRSRTNSFGSRSTSSRVLPTSSSVSSEVAAVEIAQPLPSKATSATRPLLVEADRHVLLVAAERVVVLELEVGVLEPAEVVRPLVVLEDLLSVQLVHAFEASGRHRRHSRRAPSRRSRGRRSSGCPSRGARVRPASVRAVRSAPPASSASSKATSEIRNGSSLPASFQIGMAPNAPGSARTVATTSLAFEVLGVVEGTRGGVFRRSATARGSGRRRRRTDPDAAAPGRRRRSRPSRCPPIATRRGSAPLSVRSPPESPRRRRSRPSRRSARLCQ